MTEALNDPVIQKTMSKSELAESLSVTRQALYYKHKQPAKDLQTKEAIEKVMGEHRSYGHKRIALELGINKKRVRRIMKLFNLKPYKRRVKRPPKPDDLNKQPAEYRNEIKGICPIRPNVIWAGDFTYIKFHNQFIYLATIIDVFTREIIGWCISGRHDRFMVMEAYRMAKERTRTTPVYFHSDQGSEYDSYDYTKQLESDKVIISMSEKGHPWENGFQESFYSHFKLDLGWPNQFETMPELIETLYGQIHYYNNNRIHSKLKTKPATFRDQYYVRLLTINQPQRNRQLV